MFLRFGIIPLFVLRFLPIFESLKICHYLRIPLSASASVGRFSKLFKEKPVCVSLGFGRFGSVWSDYCGHRSSKLLKIEGGFVPVTHQRHLVRLTEARLGEPSDANSGTV
jgi:hypothetical protein